MSRSDQGSRDREGSTLTRVLSTPIFTLVRPRSAARADARTVVRDADLPASLSSLVERVCIRTRLWRGEQSDVAGELCAHFLDGLESGRTPEQLREAFGSVKATARLIRRAKQRARPLVWRLWAGFWCAVGWGLLAILGLYVFLFVRYMLLEPTISRNISAEINQRIAQTPPQDRAWPELRAAYLMLTPVGDGSPESFAPPEFDPATGQELQGPVPLHDAFARWDIEGESLDGVRNYLSENEGALDRVRAAAARPALGLLLTDATDVEVERHGMGMGLRPEYDLTGVRTTPTENPALISVLLPNLVPMRFLSGLLASDARLAALDGDAARFMGDIEAMLGMGAQVRQQRVLIADLVAIAMDARALQAIDYTLVRHPGLLSDEQVAALAHALSRIGNDGPLVTFDGERAMFEDTLQRLYSDDGSGNGVVTREGMRELARMFTDFGPIPPEMNLASDALGPIQSAVVADRASMQAMYERFIGQAERAARTPMWAHDDLAMDADIEQMAGDPIQRTRYMLVYLLMPALNRAALSGEDLLQRRDATIVALAIELHRRRTGAHPAALDEVPAAILPSVPRDRFTGEAIGYALVDGRPVVYSRGVDRDDDGGRAPSEDSPRRLSIRPWRVDQWMPLETVQHYLADHGLGRGLDGDWILWPPSDTEQD
ncbi:MAG: hypothetical protein KDA05_04865 [Phycisphaerales bacterium]|nr:hypothetical protein [Phycisphaerales bacterium]MCB9840094.1 hypothetical protein [Phycisphaeraceae bacterium]